MTVGDVADALAAGGFRVRPTVEWWLAGIDAGPDGGSDWALGPAFQLGPARRETALRSGCANNAIQAHARSNIRRVAAAIRAVVGPLRNWAGRRGVPVVRR